jgi:exodeoxyribonuclease-3
MKIISLNVNGLRSAIKKGLIPWLLKEQADVICFQEIKATEQDLPDEMHALDHYHRYYFSAEKKGYSGVALYSLKKPDQVHFGLDWHLCDSEGRYLQADFGDLSVASLYLPSGSSGPARQEEKFKFMKQFFLDLEHQQKSGRQYILCGDWNIAHTINDIKNWRSNQKNSGFLPEERAWLTEILEKFHLIDAFRYLCPEKIEYSWWSNRGQAYQNNVGWRIDYQIISAALASSLVSFDMPRTPKFSDHAPLVAVYKG